MPLHEKHNYKKWFQDFSIFCLFWYCLNLLWHWSSFWDRLYFWGFHHCGCCLFSDDLHFWRLLLFWGCLHSWCYLYFWCCLPFCCCLHFCCCLSFLCCLPFWWSLHFQVFISRVWIVFEYSPTMVDLSQSWEMCWGFPQTEIQRNLCSEGVQSIMAHIFRQRACLHRWLCMFVCFLKLL